LTFAISRHHNSLNCIQVTRNYRLIISLKVLVEVAFFWEVVCCPLNIV